MHKKSIVKALGLVLIIAFALAPLAACSKAAKKPQSLADVQRNKQFRILFLGDTSFAESYDGMVKHLEKYGYDRSMEKMAPMLKDADFSITNLETPITDLEESPYSDQKTYVHWTHVKHAPEQFKKHNMRVFSLANNHTLDYAMPGLEQTFKIMKEYGFEWFGAGLNEKEAQKPYIREFDFNGKKFKMAVIGAYQYSKSYDKKYDFYADGDKGGANRLSKSKIAKQIAYLKEQDPSTFVIIYPHWGGNYSWKNKGQVKMAHALIDAGADMIIGHGAHGMQEIEYYKGKWIIYSIGNFVFLTGGRYSKLKHPAYSMGAELILEDKGKKLEKWIRMYPIYSNNKKTKYQPRFLNEEHFARFHKVLLEKSALAESQSRIIVTGQDDIGRYVEFKVD